MWCAVLYCTVLYCTVLYCIVRYFMMSCALHLIRVEMSMCYWFPASLSNFFFLIFFIISAFSITPLPFMYLHLPCTHHLPQYILLTPSTLSQPCIPPKTHPPYCGHGQFANSRDVPLVSLRRTTTNTTPGIGGGSRTLLYNSYNKSENNVLVTSESEVTLLLQYHSSRPHIHCLRSILLKRFALLASHLLPYFNVLHRTTPRYATLCSSLHLNLIYEICLSQYSQFYNIASHHIT